MAVLPETILPSSFRCAYIAIFAAFQIVILWCSGQCAGLEIPSLRVQISAGRALKERQCTLKGQAWYANVWGSTHWRGVYRMGDRHWWYKIFLIGC